jgi:hypothetical protein
MSFYKYYFKEDISKEVLKDMKAFGLFKSDIDSEGYVTLYHGGKKLPEKLNKDEIFFMTPNEEEANDYAKMRDGEVFTIKVKPEDVSWNQGSYEVEFDKGGYIKNGKIIPLQKKKSISKIIDGVSPESDWNTDKNVRNVSSYKGIKVGHIFNKTNNKVLEIAQFKNGYVQFRFNDKWYDADMVLDYEMRK